MLDRVVLFFGVDALLSKCRSRCRRHRWRRHRVVQFAMFLCVMYSFVCGQKRTDINMCVHSTRDSWCVCVSVSVARRVYAVMLYLVNNFPWKVPLAFSRNSWILEHTSHETIANVFRCVACEILVMFVFFREALSRSELIS